MQIQNTFNKEGDGHRGRQTDRGTKALRNSEVQGQPRGKQARRDFLWRVAIFAAQNPLIKCKLQNASMPSGKWQAASDIATQQSRRVQTVEIVIFMLITIFMRAKQPGTFPTWLGFALCCHLTSCLPPPSLPPLLVELFSYH